MLICSTHVLTKLIGRDKVTCVVAVEPWVQMATAIHPQDLTVLWKSETFCSETLDRILGAREPLAEQKQWMRRGGKPGVESCSDWLNWDERLARLSGL